MQEKPKEKENLEDEVVNGRDSWEEDQIRRGYYYDDAHGYEHYEPEEDDSDAADDQESC